MKFLKKFEKLEDKANEGLGKLGNKLWLFMLSLIPQFIKDFYFKQKEKLINWFWTHYNKTKAFLILAKNWILNKKDQLFTTMDKVQSFPIKDKAHQGIDLLNKIILKTPLKNHAQSIQNFLQKYLEKLNHLFQKMNNPQFYIAFSALIMISFGTYGVYVSSQKIYLGEFNTREPASVQKYVQKPEYKKFPVRTVKVLNVKVPVFKKSESSIRSVTVDFTVRTNTRFAKMYLEEYEYKLKDYFFLTVEPVVSEFPLETEGKSILREKIRRELNQFLKENRVEGEVEEVKIVFIIAS